MSVFSKLTGAFSRTILTLTESEGGGASVPYVGMGDVPGVPAADVVFSNQRWFTGLGTNNANIRVDAAQSDIGYSNNKFSTADYDTATGLVVYDFPRYSESPWTYNNMATPIGDTIIDATPTVAAYANLTLPSAFTPGSDLHIRYFFEDDGDQTVFPRTRFRVSGSASRNFDIQFNKVTGEIYEMNIHSSYTYTVTPVTGGHAVDIYYVNSDNNDGFLFRHWPSHGKVLDGSVDVTAMGPLTATFEVEELTNGIAYNSTWYDQVGSDDAVQTTTTLQPLINRQGVSIYDGVGDILKSPYQLTDGDDFTILMVLTSVTTSLSKNILSISDISNNCFRIHRQSATNLSFVPYVSAATSAWRWDASALWGGGRGLLVIRYNSVTGAKCSFNNVDLTQTRAGQLGTVDTNLGEIEIQGNGSTGNGEDFVESVAIYSGDYLTDQNLTDVYNQWVINDAL